MHKTMEIRVSCYFWTEDNPNLYISKDNKEIKIELSFPLGKEVDVFEFQTSKPIDLTFLELEILQFTLPKTIKIYHGIGTHKLLVINPAEHSSVQDRGRIIHEMLDFLFFCLNKE